MRGDVSILGGKLCYEFDISPEIAAAMQNKKGRFFKGVDEWIIHQIDQENRIAFCYQPMVTTQTHTIKNLQDKVAILQCDLADLGDMYQELIDEYKFEHVSLKVKARRFIGEIKTKINCVAWKLFKKVIFKSNYYEGRLIKAASIPR
jgi:hypothetical protein